MNAKLRPSFSQIVLELERRQAERKQKDEPAVKGESSNDLLALTHLILQINTKYNSFWIYFFLF